MSVICRKSLLLAGASFLALTVMASRPDAVFAAEQVDNTDDGSAVVLTAGNSAKFEAPAAGTDEQFQVGNTTNVGDGGVVVSATTADGVGEVIFIGNSTATGTIGASANRLGLLTLGATTFTVTITGDVFAVNTEVSGTGTVNFQGDLTTALNFGANGTVNMSDGKNITGAVTTSTANTGTLSLLGASIITGDIGVTGVGRELNLVTINTGAVSVTGDVAATTVNFAGDGSLTIATGKTLEAAVTTTTDDTGTLNFAGDITTGGTIGANGKLLKLIDFQAGAASIVHDLFATNINISGGTATYSSNQAYEGILTVSSGATLDLAGNTVTGTGTLVLDSGSTLKTTITSGTVAGKITTTGNATVNSGTTLNITVSDSDLIANGAIFTIVDGTGGSLVSSSITIIDNSSSLSFTVSGGEDLIITAVRTSFTTAVTSGPAAGAAAALQTISESSPTGDMSTVIDALNALSTTEQSTAIATTAPEANGGTVAASLSAQNLSLGTVGNRLDDVRNGDSAGLQTGFSSGDVLDGIGIWTQGFGNTVDQDSHDETDGYEADTYGIAFGTDKLVTDRVRVGLAYSYAYSDVDSTNASTGDGTTVDSHQATLYGGYRGDGYFVNAMLGGGYNMYDSARKVTIGSINRTAEGDYEGWQGTAKIGGGVNFKAGGSVITPTASLQYTHIALDSYTESGADSLNLSVDDQDYDVLQSSLGAKFAYPVKTDSGTFIPEVRAAWLYDFIGDKQQSTSTFSGGGGSFATDGADPAQNSVTFGASLSFLSNDTLTLAANYDAELKEDFIGHSASLQLRIDF